MKEIKIAVEGAKSLPYNKLQEFQDDLKTLSKTRYEQLRSDIKRLGFSFSIHVWQHKGKNYIIDGHQRLFTVKQMVENEGYKVPNLPISIVKATSFKEAKQKVLAGASQFGEVTEKGLLEFLDKNDIKFDDVVSNYNFPEINLDSISKKLNLDQGEEIQIDPDMTADMKHSSEHVKQVQLFFSSEDHAEFMHAVDELAKKYKTENITDTVMECVREVHSAKKTKSK